MFLQLLSYKWKFGFGNGGYGGDKGKLRAPAFLLRQIYFKFRKKLLKNIKKGIFQKNKDKFQNLLQLRFKI